jgi:hypothetical protein
VSQHLPFHAKRLPAHALALGVLLLGLSASVGCSSFGNARLVKELQSENERLLAEFRAQRDRAEELEKANRLQAARLDESEKLLARLSQSSSGTGRLSSLPPSFGSNGFNTGSLGRQTGASGLPPNAGFPSRQDAAGQIDAESGLRWQPRVGPAN